LKKKQLIKFFLSLIIFYFLFITQVFLYAIGNAMSTIAKATVHLKFASEKQLDTLLSALTPEAKAPPTRRASIRLKKEEAFLTLIVNAEDTVALRATINAYLRWIESTIKIMEVVEHT